MDERMDSGPRQAELAHLITLFALAALTHSLARSLSLTCCRVVDPESCTSHTRRDSQPHARPCNNRNEERGRERL